MKSGATPYRFGPFTLLPSEHLLLCGGKPLHLARKDFELLVFLVDHAGSLVRKESLHQHLWPDTAVEDGNLTKHISTVRKALGDADGARRYIETVPRVGFRFVAPVARRENAHVATPRRAKVTRAAAGMLAVALACAAAQISGRPPLDSSRWNALAILPFTTLGQGDIDPLGLGLADGIVSRLSGQSLLSVRPTSAVRGYLGAHRPDHAGVGRALRVDVILDGHIQRSGDTVRVSVQLTDVQAGAAVWAEVFEEPAGELFRLEDAIAERVASALRLRLAGAEQARLSRRYTQNTPAYAAYVTGRHELLRYTPAGVRRAVASFEHAAALDPSYTLGRAGLAMASAEMYLRFAPAAEVEEWGERAEREANAALALDPDLAEAHLSRAAVYRKREFDWDATISASRRALVLNPHLDQARFFTAAGLYHQGLLTEALAEMEHGRRIGGPDTVEPLRIAALVALFGGDFERAREQLEDLSGRSGRAIGDTYLALAYYYSGEVARARAMLEQLTSEPSASTAARSRVALAGVLAAGGDRATARTILDDVVAAEYRDHHVTFGIGAAFAQLGAHGTAVGWLRQAADTGFPCAAWYRRDPLLDPLRGDAAFLQLLEDLDTRRVAAAARYRALALAPASRRW